MERGLDLKLLLDDGDQHVDGDGDPNLRLHRVLGGAVEALDAQVLFDPLEEQLDLPAASVKRADGECWQDEVVGQKDQMLVGLGIVIANASQVAG